VEQVWRDKKIVSKGWKSILLLRRNKFGFRSGKHLKPALLFRHSGFGLLENDKRKYEGQW
jgi:hypothetical protein